MVLAIFGCIFGVLGIFTIGLVFVPLAALCALLGLVSSIAKPQFSTAVLSIVAGILAGVGWVVSPSLWVLTAVLMAPPHAHKDEGRDGIVSAAPPVVTAPNASISPPPTPPRPHP